MKQHQVWSLILLLIIITQSSASWECIVRYGCQTQYNKAKNAHPKIVNDCSKLAKAGTNNFKDNVFLNCLQTFGIEYAEVRNLISCSNNYCVAFSE